VLFILALFIFLGSSWAPERQYRCAVLPHAQAASRLTGCLACAESNIKVAVLDMDGSGFGAALRGAAAGAPFSISVLPAAGAVAVSFESLLLAVEAGTYHAALTAEAGATAALEAALAGEAPFDVSAASTLVLDEGRSGAAMVSLLRAEASQLVSAATAAAEWMLLGSPPGAAPVAPRPLFLHPVPHAGMFTAAGIAFILAWVRWRALCAANRLCLPASAAPCVTPPSCAMTRRS
jgi:hypothetical protein